MGSLAEWMNGRGVKTREGNWFTAHALKDMFKNTFYVGKVRYKGQDYAGQHHAVVSTDIVDAVRAMKGASKASK